MAVIWTVPAGAESLAREKGLTEEMIAGEPQLVGWVTGRGTRSVQVMSDVWENEEYFTYWTGMSLATASCSHYLGYTEGEDGKYISHYAYAQVTVDVTREVAEAIAAEHEARARIQVVRDGIDEAHRLVTGVRVVGRPGTRKLNPGEVYEVTMGPRPGQFGSYITVRDIRGQRLFIDPERVKIVEAELRYPDGPCPCPKCLAVYPGGWRQLLQPIEDTGYRPRIDLTCRACRVEEYANGYEAVPMPVPPGNRAASEYLRSGHHYVTTPAGLEGMCRSVAENHTDPGVWLVYADWLEEHAHLFRHRVDSSPNHNWYAEQELDRAKRIRLALTPKEVVKAIEKAQVMGPPKPKTKTVGWVVRARAGAETAVLTQVGWSIVPGAEPRLFKTKKAAEAWVDSYPPERGRVVVEKVTEVVA